MTNRLFWYALKKNLCRSCANFLYWCLLLILVTPQNESRTFTRTITNKGIINFLKIWKKVQVVTKWSDFYLKGIRRAICYVCQTGSTSGLSHYVHSFMAAACPLERRTKRHDCSSIQTYTHTTHTFHAITNYNRLTHAWKLFTACEERLTLCLIYLRV